MYATVERVILDNGPVTDVTHPVSLFIRVYPVLLAHISPFSEHYLQQGNLYQRMS